MSGPNPATTEWVPLYTKNAIKGPKGDTGPTGNPGPAGIDADIDYLGDYVPGVYNDGDVVYHTDGIAYLCIKDGVTTPPEPWPGTGGVVLAPHKASHETGGTDALTSISGGIITSGTISDARLSNNVPLKNTINTFTQGQYISVNVNPELRLIDTSQPADARVFRVVNASGSLYLQSTNDAVTVGQGATIIDRLGNTSFSGSIKERSRSAPIGEWTGFTPFWKTAGTQPVMGNGNISGAFTMIGKTCFFIIRLNTGSTTTYGTGGWTFGLPPNFPLAGAIAEFVSGTAWVYAGSGLTYLGQVHLGQFFTGVVDSITVSMHTPNAWADFISGSTPINWASIVPSYLFISGMYQIA